MIAALLGIFATWFAVFAIVRRCDSRGRNMPAVVWTHAMLSAGLAIGLTSCLYFVMLVLDTVPGRTYCYCETIAAMVIGLVAWFWPSYSSRSARSLKDSGNVLPVLDGGALRDISRSEMNAVLSKIRTIIFCVALAFSTLGMAGMFVAEPYGDWDAWNTWTLRARYLFLAGEDWHKAFDSAFRHPDYPLMLSCSIARLWTYWPSDANGDRHHIPQGVAAIFTLASVGLLTGGVARLRGTNQGLLAGLALLGTDQYFLRGASQYSDVPLSFYYLATLLLLALYDADERKPPGLLFLAGLAAALTAWTKNEGIMFLSVVLFIRTSISLLRGGLRGMLRELSLLALGAAPIIFVIVLDKICIAYESDIVSGQTWQAIWPRLVDTSRITFIAKAMLGSLWHVGKGLVVILPLAFLLVDREPDRRGILPGLVGVLVLVLAGYFFVYWTSQLELAWHVNNSVDRLLVQVWPSALLAVFIYLGDTMKR
jgi:hypothetical protein